MLNSLADYRHPSFPHESTADQSFEEDQFESYRSLGVHMCESMLSDKFNEELFGQSTATS